MHIERFLRCLALLSFVAIAFQSQIAVAAEKVLTDADKGGKIHLKTGRAFQLRLSSNPSTGYMWYVQRSSTPLLKLASQSQTSPTKPGVGRPIFQVFRFEAKRPGEGVLLLHYVRSWEPPTPDDQQFELHVLVD